MKGKSNRISFKRAVTSFFCRTSVKQPPLYKGNIVNKHRQKCICHWHLFSQFSDKNKDKKEHLSLKMSEETKHIQPQMKFSFEKQVVLVKIFEIPLKNIFLFSILVIAFISQS